MDAPTTSISTTTTPAPPPVVVIAATLEVTFTPELSDKTSPEFQKLEAEVVAVYDVIYRTRYGILFIRSFVIEFRSAAGRLRVDNTEAEMGIEFNETASTEEIPTADNVAETLKEAVSNPNATFNLTVDASSVQVIVRTTAAPTTAAPTTAAPTTAALTTAAPTTAAPTTAAPTMGEPTTAAPTTAAPTTAAATTAAPTTAAPTTAAPTTAAPTTAAATTAAATTTTAANIEAVTTTRLTFRSVGETFTSDLGNSSSAAFISRARLIASALVPFYQAAFSSFRSLTVISFRNGSIINNLDLGFASSNVPNGTQIGNVLAGAASNITTFNIDPTSISVDGTQVSSGVSHKISLITASILVLLSWLLTSQ